MKKIIILLSIFSLYSCTEKNQEYYQEHLEEAKSKINDCEEMMMNAFKLQDEEKIKELDENLECKSAHKATYQAKQEKIEFEKEIRKEEKRLKKIEDEKQYKIDLKGYQNKYSALTYSQLKPIEVECIWGSSSVKFAKCDAFKEIFKTKKEAAIKNISDKYSDQELLDENKNWCSGLKFDKTKCEISKLAITKQKINKVKFYLENRNELKDDFNSCLKSYKLLLKKSKYKDSTNLMDSFKCVTVRKAASELNIHQFSNPL